MMGSIFEWVLKNGDKLGGLATVLMMFIALWALSFANRQISAQREATAKDIYRDYLKLAFDNPKYANPKKFGATSKERWKEWIQDEKYRWFVAFMLNSYDEIISSRPGDDDWLLVALADFKVHEGYLTSSAFLKDEDGWSLFSPALAEIAKKLKPE
jgi:hypothetical protein